MLCLPLEKALVCGPLILLPPAAADRDGGNDAIFGLALDIAGLR